MNSSTTIQGSAYKRPTLLDRNIPKNKTNDTSLSAMTFLFSEILQYTQKKVKGIQEFEKRLSDLGYRVGVKMLELVIYREKNYKRDLKLLQVLQFVHTNLWMVLFNKKADALERSTENEDEYMISDNDPMITKFISIPKEMSSLNCSAFVAGIIEAVMDGCHFPAKVSAHSTGTDQFPTRTTYLIKFDKSGKFPSLFLSYFIVPIYSYS